MPDANGQIRGITVPRLWPGHHTQGEDKQVTYRIVPEPRWGMWKWELVSSKGCVMTRSKGMFANEDSARSAAEQDATQHGVVARFVRS